MARRFKAGDEPVPGYRLVEFLGRGGFGEVWKATGRGVDVALKIIDLGGKTGYKEFKALKLVKRIRHPNLVPIVGFWLTDEDGAALDESQVDTSLSGLAANSDSATTGTVLVERPKSRATELIIAMGLGDMSLAERLDYYQKKGLPGIPLSELLDYMQDAARGIDFLNSPVHDLGDGPHSAVRHCDIKPQNMMIVGGAVQICDFGLARAESDVRLTSAAVSPAYGAPESIDGRLPTPTTDQYSLAVSYFEMRSGSLPFSDPSSYMGVVKAHLMGQLDLDRLPPEERDVLRKATERDPSNRYVSCAKFVKALRQACPTDDSVQPMTAPPSRLDLSPYQATMIEGAPSSSPTPVSGGKETEKFQAGRTPVSDSWRSRSTDRGLPGASKFRSKKLLKLVAPLLLIGAVAGGAWYWNNGGAARANRQKVEEFKSEVRELARQGSGADAFARLSAGPTMERDEFDWLRGEVGTLWLADLEKQYQASESVPLEERGVKLASLGAAADQLIEAYPRLKEAGEFKLRIDESLEEIAPQIFAALKQNVQQQLVGKDYGGVLTFIEGLATSIDENQKSELNDLVRTAWLADVRADHDKAQQQQDRTERAASLEQATAALAAMVEQFPDDVAVKVLSSQVQRELGALKGGSQIEEHLAAAEQHLRDQKWEELSTALESARTAANEAGQADAYTSRIAELQNLAKLAAVDSSSDVAAALTHFRERVRQGDVERLDVLSTTLRDLAKRHCEQINDVADLAGQVHELAGGTGDAELVTAVAADYQSVLTDRVLAAIDRSEATDHAQLKQFCNAAIAAGSAEPLVRLCLAECLVNDRPSGADRQMASSLAAEIKDGIDADHDPYWRYVRSLVASNGSNPNWKGIGQELDKLLPSLEASPWGLKSPARQERLAELLVSVAKGHRQPGEKSGAVARLQENPFKDAGTANRAFSWLDAAQRLRPEMSEAKSTAAVLHAVAAAYKPEPLVDIVNAVVNQQELLKLQPKASAEERQLLYLYGKLQPSGAAGQLARLQAYSRLLDYEMTDQLDPDDALPLYRELIHPLLSLPLPLESLDESDRLLLARLHAAKGQLIRYHPYVEWPFPDKRKQGYDAYHKAVTLDPANPEYLVGKGLAAVMLDRDQYESEAMQCADKAIEMNGKYAGGYGLKSNLQLIRARRLTDSVQREALFRETFKNAEQAAKLAARLDPEYSTYFVRLSTSAVEWANYMRGSERRSLQRRQEEALKRAVESAETARDSARLYKENALRALGNANEDLVWLVDPRDESRHHYYDQAVAAFTAAIEHRGDVADQHLDRGRCQYKRVAYSGHDKSYLDLAQRDLKQAINLDPELASAHRWLAKVYARLADPASADASMKKALELAAKRRDRSPTDYQAYAIDWAEMAATPEERRSRATTLLSQVKSVADGGQTELPYRNELVLLIAGTLGSPKEQLAHYDKYLPKEAKDWKAADVPIAIKRIRCWIETTPDRDLIPARDATVAQLQTAVTLAPADAYRAEALDVSARLATLCALGRPDADVEGKKKDRHSAVSFYEQAVKYTHDSRDPTELWGNYAFSIFQLMLEDSSARTKPEWQKALATALDRAQELAPDQKTKAVYKQRKADYEKRLKDKAAPAAAAPS